MKKNLSSEVVREKVAQVSAELAAAKADLAAAVRRDALEYALGSAAQSRAAAVRTRIEMLTEVLDGLESAVLPACEFRELRAEVASLEAQCRAREPKMQDLKSRLSRLLKDVQALPIGIADPQPWRGEMPPKHPTVAEKERVFAELRALEAETQHAQLRIKVASGRSGQIYERCGEAIADLLSDTDAK